MFFIGLFFVVWSFIFVLRFCMRLTLYRIWRDQNNTDPSLLESKYLFKMFWIIAPLETAWTTFGLIVYFHHHEASWEDYLKQADHVKFVKFL
jgi:tryptophan-rich sensory protein